MEKLRQTAVLTGDISRGILRAGYALIASALRSPKRLRTRKIINNRTGHVRWHTYIDDPRITVAIDTPFFEDIE